MVGSRLPLTKALLMVLMSEPSHGHTAEPRGAASLRLAELQADRPHVPSARLALQINQKLQSLNRGGLMAGLPKALQLDLKVEGTGRVVAAAATPKMGLPTRWLETQALAWQFEVWPLTGVTHLQLQLKVESMDPRTY